jgi:hypothetical protein
MCRDGRSLYWLLGRFGRVATAYFLPPSCWPTALDERNVGYLRVFATLCFVFVLSAAFQSDENEEYLVTQIHSTVLSLCDKAIFSRFCFGLRLALNCSTAQLRSLAWSICSKLLAAGCRSRFLRYCNGPIRVRCHLESCKRDVTCLVNIGWKNRCTWPGLLYDATEASSCCLHCNKI